LSVDFRAAQEVAFGDDADQISVIINDRKSTDFFCNMSLAATATDSSGDTEVTWGSDYVPYIHD